jgi:hypothetical protein
VVGLVLVGRKSFVIEGRDDVGVDIFFSLAKD